MNFETKKRWVCTLLVLLALWPPTHYALAQHYEFNPWKFFGWAMYAVPPPLDVRLRIMSQRGEAETLIAQEVLSAAIRREIEDYNRLRKMLGRLLPPDKLAQHILETRPDDDGVVIRVVQPALSARTGRIEMRRQRYQYSQ